MTTDTTIRAKFKAKFLPYIAPFMGVQDIRYYLNGFLIQKAPQGGVYIVATNGHCLAVVHDKDGMIEGADEYIVRRETKLVAACKGKTELPGGLHQHVILQAGRVLVAPDFDMAGSSLETYVMHGQPRVEGKFPVWTKVLPDFEKLQPGIRSAVANAKYIGLFAAIGKGEAHGSPMVRFWQNLETGPDSGEVHAGIIVQHLHIPEFLGMVMPGRDDQRTRDGYLETLRGMRGETSPQ